MNKIKCLCGEKGIICAIHIKEKLAQCVIDQKKIMDEWKKKNKEYDRIRKDTKLNIDFAFHGCLTKFDKYANILNYAWCKNECERCEIWKKEIYKYGSCKARCDNCFYKGRRRPK